MANQSAKAMNGKASEVLQPSNELLDATANKDVNLARYVRANAPRIISALTCAANRAGETESWADMQSYIGLAAELGTLSDFGLLTTTAAAPSGSAARAMTAGVASG